MTAEQHCICKRLPEPVNEDCPVHGDRSSKQNYAARAVEIIESAVGKNRHEDWAKSDHSTLDMARDADDEIERLQRELLGEKMRRNDEMRLRKAAERRTDETKPRQLSATERLHNICDALSEQADESPFSREEWDRVDRQTVRLQNALRNLLSATEDTLRSHPETECCAVTRQRCAEAHDALGMRPEKSEPLCPHGMVLADNVCGPCSEGRPNRRTEKSTADPVSASHWGMHPDPTGKTREPPHCPTCSCGMAAKKTEPARCYFGGAYGRCELEAGHDGPHRISQNVEPSP